MITVDQLREKIKRDLTNYVPSGAPVPTHVTENMLLLLELMGGGGGGGGSSTPVPSTYADLKAAILAGTLVPGQQYLFTDFQTVHYITDGNSNQLLDQIVTGPIEPLVVTAISTTQFNSMAVSLIYPHDVIHIDFDPMNWIRDLSFADQNLGPAPEIIIPGWKGTIMFRHDRLYDISMGFDWKHCKFRRWKFAYGAYDPLSTTYGSGAQVIDGTDIWLAFMPSTPAGTLGQPSYWTKTGTIAATPYQNVRPFGTDFVDTTVFGKAPGVTDDYNLSVRNFHILPSRDNTDYWNSNGSLLNNNVFWLTNNGYYNYIGFRFGSDCVMNTFTCGVGSDFTAGNYFLNNIISVSGVMRSNLIGDGFQNSSMMNPSRNIILGTVQQCIFGDQFENNKMFDSMSNSKFCSISKFNIYNGAIANTIIKQGCSLCVLPKISNGMIGYNLTNSTFNGDYSSSLITDDCGQLNFNGGASPISIEQAVNRLTIMGNMSGLILNAANAPRVYGAAISADKTILVNAATTACLQYLDNASVMITIPLSTP